MAAAAGLKPQEFYALTFREFECYLQGREEYWERVMELLAWVQTNLMNMQVAKGKKISVEDLLPKKLRKKRREAQGDQLLDTSYASMAAAREEREHLEWLQSAQGQEWAAYLENLRYDPAADP